jgi:hypothetical protein
MRKYRLEQVSQEQPVGLFTWVALGIIVIILLSVGGYFGYQQRRFTGPSENEEDTSKDPLNRRVNIDFSKLPNSLATVLGVPQSTPQTMSTLFKTGELNSYSKYSALELYNIFCKSSVLMLFAKQFIPCFDESRTNPRIALNIIQQFGRYERVLIVDFTFAGRSPEMVKAKGGVPYPGTPLDSRYLDFSEFLRNLKENPDRNDFISTISFFPYLLQFMFENSISDLKNIVEFHMEDYMNEKVVPRNQDFVDICNFILRQISLHVPEMMKSLSFTEFRIGDKYSLEELAVPFYFFSYVLRALNNTYDIQCTTDILPNLMEHVKSTLTNDTVIDLKAKGTFRESL